jgi:hypothetical protein
MAEGNWDQEWQFTLGVGEQGLVVLMGMREARKSVSPQLNIYKEN